MHKLPHNLPQDLRVRILGNYELMFGIECEYPAGHELQKISRKTFHRKIYFT